MKKTSRKVFQEVFLMLCLRSINSSVRCEAGPYTGVLGLTIIFIEV